MSYSPFPPRPPQLPREPITTLWIMHRGARKSGAVLYPHPLGFELYILDSKSDGFARTQVHRERGDAEHDATATYDRLLALGWTVVEP